RALVITVTYPLSLHDALPIYVVEDHVPEVLEERGPPEVLREDPHVQHVRVGEQDLGFRPEEPPRGLGRVPVVTSEFQVEAELPEDRKSTRLNSSHVKISYAVF